MMEKLHLITVNHGFGYELEKIIREFFINADIETVGSLPPELLPPYIVTEVGDKLTVTVNLGSFCKTLSADVSETTECELELARLVYMALCEYSGKTLPWGLLTGVRPVKLYRHLCDTRGEEYARQRFLSGLCVSKEKIRLAALTCGTERRIIELSERNSFSLYISIPFCPSRCSYCSFVSQTVEKAKRLIEPYVALLCDELRLTGSIAADLGLRLLTVYIGGGTPTTLSAKNLSLIIGTVRESFDMSHCREFTVEAGRPDTITEEKLMAIKFGGCDRLSVNPQTLNDSVLERIGRRHTSEDFFRAFELSRAAGFTHINTDLIAGLSGDTPQSFQNTVDGICKLSPESVTVHTLSLKRSSFLTAGIKSADSPSDSDINPEFVPQMLSAGSHRLLSNAYTPYYLYRQSKMLCNAENTGWSKQGYEGLYNVFIMDETHTILACGAGAVTKLKAHGVNLIERIFNFKYPYEYIDRFGELCERKQAIYRFYKEHFSQGDEQ